MVLQLQAGAINASFLLMLSLPWVPIVLLTAAGTASKFPYGTCCFYSLIPCFLSVIALFYRRYVYNLKFRYLRWRHNYILLPLGVLKHFALIKSVSQPGTSIRIFAFAVMLSEIWALPSLALLMSPPKPRFSHGVGGVVGFF